MQFISNYGNYGVVLQHTRRRVVKTPNMGEIAEVTPGIKVKFRPLVGGFETRLLATRNRTGKAFGKVDSAEAARENQIDEQELIQMLMAHPAYGVDFVAVEETGQQVPDESSYLVNKTDGSVYCTVCDKHLPNKQGVKGHVRSNSHQDLLTKLVTG